jgi:cyclopropane fatty-acyl-phospholipid synthase-like methyltransferase
MVVKIMTETHWTQRLFVENAELYLPFLELARDRAKGEVSALAGLLDRSGVPTGARVLDVACGIGGHAVPPVSEATVSRASTSRPCS